MHKIVHKDLVCTRFGDKDPKIAKTKNVDFAHPACGACGRGAQQVQWTECPRGGGGSRRRAVGRSRAGAGKAARGRGSVKVPAGGAGSLDFCFSEFRTAAAASAGAGGADRVGGAIQLR